MSEYEQIVGGAKGNDSPVDSAAGACAGGALGEMNYQEDQDGGGCSFAGVGRGDCSNYVGLPGHSIPDQHDGEDDTVDCYGKPNGWCWSCWKSEKIERLERQLQPAPKSFFTAPNPSKRKSVITLEVAPNKSFRAVEYDDCVFFLLEREYTMFSIPENFMYSLGHAEIRVAKAGVEQKCSQTTQGLVSCAEGFDQVAMRLNWDQHKLPYNTKDAMDHLRAMFAVDPAYAHGWHCNLAMAIHDTWGPEETGSDRHKEQLRIGEEAASRFMQNTFGCTTSNDMLFEPAPETEKASVTSVVHFDSEQEASEFVDPAESSIVIDPTHLG